jgi:hypothetical protein
MVILRKVALRVQANLGTHSSKIKNAASLLETTFEPFNFHRDMCVLHRDSSSVRAPAGASGGTAFNVRSPRQPFDDDVAQRFRQRAPQSSGIWNRMPRASKSKLKCDRGPTESERTAKIRPALHGEIPWLRRIFPNLSPRNTLAYSDALGLLSVVSPADSGLLSCKRERQIGFS